MKRIAMILSIAATSAAYAGTTVKSEIFYQAAPEKHQVTPALSYSSNSTKVTGGTSKTTEQTLNVKYEYGINEMLSAGLTLGYLTGDTTTTGAATTKNKGLSDITYFLRGQNSFMEGSSMHYGADINMSLGKSEVNTDKNENNAMSGGIGLAPYVGYTWLVGPGAVGAKVSTALDLGDRTVKTTTSGVPSESKETGGNITALTGFYEQAFDKTLVGASFTYGNINTTKSTTAGTDTKTSGGNFWELKVYPTYEVSETATIVGEIAYESFLSDASVSGGTVTKIDSQDQFSLNVGGRFTF